MNTPGIITLEKAKWDELSSLWPGKRSLLSPLEAPGTGKLSRVKSQQFINAGWIEPSGQIAGYLHQALQTLASTRSLAELMFVREGSPVTCTVYFTSEEQPSSAGAWGMTTDEEDHITLYNVEAARKLVTEYLHSIAEKSPASTANYFSAILQPAEAWILGIMLDMQRQSAIQAAVQNPSKPKEPARCVCQVASMLTIMSNIGNPQNAERVSTMLADEPGWSVLFFFSELMQPVALSQEQLEAALRNLVIKKLVMRQNTDFTLGNGLTRFANQFLIPEEAAFLKTCQEHNEQLEEDQLTCLRGGKSFLYTLISQQAPDRINLSAGSSKLLTQTARRVFNKPVSLASVTMPVPTAGNQPVNGICPSCGAAIKPGKRFCGVCGTPVRLPQASRPTSMNPVCPQCGNALKPGTKFCGNCGYRF